GLHAASFGVAYNKRTNFGPFAEHIITTSDHMTMYESLVAPLFDAGMDFNILAIHTRLHKAVVDLQQWRAHDAVRFFQFAPGRKTVLLEEVQRGRIHPAQKVGEDDNAGGIAIAKVDVHR